MGVDLKAALQHFSCKQKSYHYIQYYSPHQNTPSHTTYWMHSPPREIFVEIFNIWNIALLTCVLTCWESHPSSFGALRCLSPWVEGTHCIYSYCFFVHFHTKLFYLNTSNCSHLKRKVINQQLQQRRRSCGVSEAAWGQSSAEESLSWHCGKKKKHTYVCVCWLAECQHC